MILVVLDVNYIREIVLVVEENFELLQVASVNPVIIKLDQLKIQIVY